MGSSSIKLAVLLLLIPLALISCQKGDKEEGTAADPIDLPIDDTYVLADLQDDVDVLTDSWGIPHIYARNDHDAWFLQGYLAARDRFAQMDMARKLAQGRIGEIIGQLPLVGPVISYIVVQEVDLYYRSLFIGADGKPVADLILDQLDEQTRAILQAHADGINAFLTDVREVKNEAAKPTAYDGLIQVSPDLIENWHVRDTLSILVLSLWTASNSVEFELAMGEALAELGPGKFYDFYRPAPDDSTTVLPTDSKGGKTGRTAQVENLSPLAHAYSQALPALRGALDASKKAQNNFAQQGMHSNNWAVAGANSATGNALIANDPHLGLLNPAYFWLCHVDSKTFGNGDVQFAGLAFPAAPGVPIGHNDSIGWAGTAANYDTYDAYIEQLSENDSNAVVYNGKNIPIRTLSQFFKLNMEPGGPSRMLDIRVVPHHGPILPGSCKKNQCVSVKWTGAEPGTEIKAFIDILFAENLTEGLDAFEQYRRGPYNWVVGDSEGRVGYIAAADLPTRDQWRNYPPYLPLPGTGEAEWGALVPENRIARYEDPESGFVVSANNDIYGSLSDNDALNDPNYFYWMVDIGYRAGRITSLLSGQGEGLDRNALTLDDMARIQRDNVSLLAGRVLPFLFDAASARPDLVDSEMETALSVLGEWDFTTPSGLADIWRPQMPDTEETLSSIAASLFHVWFGYTAVGTFGDDFDKADIDLPGRESESGPQIEARALINLLIRENETWFGDHWWDDVTTAGWETREDVLLVALRNAMDYLEEELGSDMAEWNWGRLHEAEFGLTFEGFTIPSFLSPVLGPGGSDGGNFTVNVGNTYDLDDDFYNSHAPAARVVMEIDGDRFPTFAVLPGGQSERPNSPHFSDQFSSYLSGELLPVYYTLDEIVPVTEERILFTPNVD